VQLDNVIPGIEIATHGYGRVKTSALTDEENEDPPPSRADGEMLVKYVRNYDKRGKAHLNSICSTGRALIF
jgi:hypothetical protein